MVDDTGTETRPEPSAGAATAPKAPTELKAKLVRLRDAMADGLVDRDEPVRLLLAAILAGEHMLLLGPPGTAKSELARRLSGVTGGTCFERLLTRFSVPEELFGPLSLKELENDRYLRCVDGYLPTATIAFVDEVFKANSAILNSLLTILNERLFDNGASRDRVPLVCLVGASNELPKGDELAALYDRFLVRYQVGPVTADRFAEMALAGDTEWTPPAPEMRLTEEERVAICEEARSVTVSPAVVDLLRGLRGASAELGLVVSDRRWKKIVKLLRTVAFVDGRGEVTPWDFWVVSHCVWSSPEQRPAVQEWYEKHLGIDASSAPERTRRVIAAMSAELESMTSATEAVCDAKTGKPLYRDQDGNEREGPEPRRMRRGSEELFLAPKQQGRSGDTNGGKGYTKDELSKFDSLHQLTAREMHCANRSSWLMETPATAVLQPRRHSAADIEDCVAQVAPTREAIEASLRDLAQKIRDAEALLAEHVIVPPGFLGPAVAGLRANQTMLEDVRDKMRSLESGFAKLPRRGERQAL